MLRHIGTLFLSRAQWRLHNCSKIGYAHKTVAHAKYTEKRQT